MTGMRNPIATADQRAVEFASTYSIRSAVSR